MKTLKELQPTLSPIDTRSNSLDGRERQKVESISEATVRAQLACILQSSIFVQSARLSRFLHFIVENTLNNSGDSIKEYVIGIEVYDRKPPYHPSQDSIVRTEARRLRGKLKEYYDSEGKRDPILIYLRTGSYVPIFRSNDLLVIEKYATTDSEFSDATLQHKIQLLEQEQESLSRLIVELLWKNQSLRELNKLEH